MPKITEDRVPRTTSRDWIGATIQSGPPRRPVANGTFKFHIYRAVGRRLLFAVTAGSAPPPSVGTGRKEVWEPFKVVPETGKPRIGFSEKEAKADIKAKGYHLVRVDVG